MKQRILVYSLLVAAIIGAHAVGTQVTAQTDQIAGGYGDLSATSKEARRAADVAVKARSAKTGKTITLVRITKAEQQVVAGLNYRVCMSVREGGHKAYTVTAVVHQNLKNKRTLSKWKKGAFAKVFESEGSLIIPRITSCETVIPRA